MNSRLQVNGSIANRLPGNLNNFFTSVDAEALAWISQCAVKGVLFPAGANPARQLSLQPEALEAVQGGNELD